MAEERDSADVLLLEEVFSGYTYILVLIPRWISLRV